MKSTTVSGFSREPRGTFPRRASRLLAPLALAGMIPMANAADETVYAWAPANVINNEAPAASITFAKGEDDEILAAVNLIPNSPERGIGLPAKIVVQRYDTPGETWSTPTSIVEFDDGTVHEALPSPYQPRLIYAGQNRWIATWVSQLATGTQYSLSDDNAITWGSKQDLGASLTALASNGQGTLLMHESVWVNSSSTTKRYLLTHPSTTWAEVAGEYDLYPNGLINVSGSNWVAITSDHYWSADNSSTWTKADSDYPDGGGDMIGIASSGPGNMMSLTQQRVSLSYYNIYLDRSDNYGHTVRSTIFQADSFVVGSGSLIHVGEGTWMAAWSVASDFFNSEIHARVSYDDGATWRAIGHADNMTGPVSATPIAGDSPTLASSGSEIILGYVDASDRPVFRILKPFGPSSADDWQLFE